MAHLVESNALPLTRQGVIDIARDACDGVAQEVRIVVTEVCGYYDLPIELATVEVNSGPNGGWRLKQVSHPAQSRQLTASILPLTSDLAAFVEMRAALHLPYDMQSVSSQEMEKEDLAPLEVLNLGLANVAPVVPFQRRPGRTRGTGRPGADEQSRPFRPIRRLEEQTSARG